MNALEKRRRFLEQDNSDLRKAIELLSHKYNELAQNNTIVAAQRDALHEVIRLGCQVAMDKEQAPNFA